MIEESKFCVQELIPIGCTDARILILYPYEFSNEPILKDNIPKMTKVIREYIKESEMYRKCVNSIQNLIWDSQKISMQNEANEHQRKADELSEQMNNGISPYAWYVKKNFDKYIDDIHYKADYFVYLDRI